ncbi:MAG: hypothetical protein U1E65_14890 [Myxococcota bacterium]
MILARFAVILAAIVALAPPQLARAAECTKILESALSEAQKAPSKKRIRPVLHGLGRCTILGKLAAAAKSAAEKPRKIRAELLAAPAAEDLGFDCKPLDSGAPAALIARRCPAPADLALSEAALSDLDAGTYVFALATYRAFVREGPVPMSAKQLLSNLLLAAALEGEELHRKRR